MKLIPVCWGASCWLCCERPQVDHSDPYTLCLCTNVCTLFSMSRVHGCDFIVNLPLVSVCTHYCQCGYTWACVCVTCQGRLHPGLCRWRYTAVSMSRSWMPGLRRGRVMTTQWCALWVITLIVPPSSEPSGQRHLGSLNVKYHHILAVSVLCVWLSVVSSPDRECGRLPQFPGCQRSERTRALSRR